MTTVTLTVGPGRNAVKVTTRSGAGGVVVHTSQIVKPGETHIADVEGGIHLIAAEIAAAPPAGEGRS